MRLTRLSLIRTIFLCKINSQTAYPKLFENEKRGLEMLARQKIIRVPQAIACEESGELQVLILEWINPGAKTEKFWMNFAEQLAGLHRVSHKRFGWEEDNWMGALMQSNSWCDKWTDFFIANRLQPQVRLARENKLLDEIQVQQFENLYKKLEDIFEPEAPAMLHGDLWSGNYLCNENDQPVLIDPAVYFGHRSMDLAMTRLFGGFDRIFYECYQETFPLPSNYQEQWTLCNLYPLLIHLNLFGRSYLEKSSMPST
jgi:fructosamine-3-kinase